MVENRKEQDKNFNVNTNNIKEDFYEYKESSYRTLWEPAFKQSQFLGESQFLEQSKNKPKSSLKNSNIIEAISNKGIT